MFKDIDWTRIGNDGICTSNSEEVKEYAKRFSQGHWTFFGLKENGLYSYSNGLTIQRYWSSSIQKYECFKSWNSEKEQWERHHTLQCGCFRHRALVPKHSFCKSAQCWRAAPNRREQPGSTEEEKGQGKQNESVTKGVLTSVSSPRRVSGNSLRENIQDFDSLSETSRFTGVCDLASFRHGVSAGMSYKTRRDEDDGCVQIIPFCREYTLSRVNSQSRAFRAISGGQLLDQSLTFRSWKFLTNMDLKFQFHHPMMGVEHPMFWFSEERVGSWMKSMFPMPNSDPVQITHWTSESRRKRTLLGKAEDLLRETCWGLCCAWRRNRWRWLLSRRIFNICVTSTFAEFCTALSYHQWHDHMTKELTAFAPFTCDRTEDLVRSLPS